jgi:hypothetical protein
MFFSPGGALARLVRVCHGFVHGYTMQKTQCLWALSRVSRVKHPQGIPTALNPLKSFVLQGLSNFAGFCRFLHASSGERNLGRIFRPHLNPYNSNTVSVPSAPWKKRGGQSSVSLSSPAPVTPMSQPFFFPELRVSYPAL